MIIVGSCATMEVVTFSELGRFTEGYDIYEGFGVVLSHFAKKLIAPKVVG